MTLTADSHRSRSIDRQPRIYRRLTDSFSECRTLTEPFPVDKKRKRAKMGTREKLLAPLSSSSSSSWGESDFAASSR